MKNTTHNLKKLSKLGLGFLSSANSGKLSKYFSKEQKNIKEGSIKMLEPNLEKDITIELKNKIKTAIEQAFDEGTESPYDLKRDIVNKLINELNKDLDLIKIQKENSIRPINDDIKQGIANKICEYLPVSIISALHSTKNSFFAGGSLIRYLVCQSRPISEHPVNNYKIITNNLWENIDWDIFVHENELQNIFKCFEHKKFILTEQSDYSKLLNYDTKIKAVYYSANKMSDMGLGTINIISGNFKSIEDVVGDFDLRFLQTAFWISDSRPKFDVLNNNVWEDLVNRKIYLTPNTKKIISLFYNTGRAMNSIKTYNRIKKYIQRGFSDQTALVETGLVNSFKSM